MLTRRRFLGKAVGGVAAGVAGAGRNSWGAGRLAWTKPIGLELYTVRQMFAEDPAQTLKDVSAAGYREVEVAGFLPPHVPAETLQGYLKAAGLAAPSGYFGMPKTADDWKKSADWARASGLRYMVTGNTDPIDADGWKRLADLFNQCGKISQSAGAQFCYHNHMREFEKHGNTNGLEILLAGCDPQLVKFEMDIFWVTYGGADPLDYWKRYPGRFPLLHIKDMKNDATGSSTEFPPEHGPNPFAPVGQGKIDWAKIFAHVRQAGAEHIFVEQDRADGSVLEAIKISYEYLRKLRVS